jgi:raffinose/stachyose/melibiose transport system substrate-binding protein
MAQAGRLMDLSKAPWVGQQYPAVKQYMSYNGKVYGYMPSLFTHGVAYNVDLFKQQGLTIPTTMAQVLTLCRTVSSSGKIPFAAGFADIGGTISWVLQRGAENVYSVDPNWTTERNDHKVSFATSPLWQRALQTIVDMKNGGCFNPAPQGTTVQDEYAMFANGKAVMTLIGSPELQNIQKINPNLNVAMFNLPPDNAENAVASLGVTTAIAANAKTAHPDEVKEFIAFLTQPEQDRLFSKTNFAVAVEDAKKGVLPDYLKDMAHLFKASKTVIAVNVAWPSKGNPLLGVLAPGVIGLFTGQSTIASILAAADQAWEKG